MQAPKVLRDQTKPNLDKLLIELLDENEEITVTDLNLPISLRVSIKFASL
jgi:hypothetical protein